MLVKLSQSQIVGVISLVGVHAAGLLLLGRALAAAEHCKEVSLAGA